MKPVLRCLATSFGSAGDFLPTLAVAGALRRRGHEVTFVANPLYASRVERAGVDFVAAGEHLDLFERIERNPAYTDLGSAGLMFRDFVEPDTEAVYRVARERMRAAPLDVVLTSDVSFGAMWAAAAHRLPSVLVTASPALWMGWESPVMFGDGPIRTALARPFTVVGRSFMRWYIGRLLRPLARRVGAPSPDVSFPAWERSAALRLGLWSPVLRAQLASDPPNGRVCGYVRASALAGAEPGLPSEVRAFLDEGPPPVVVGLGSVIGLASGALLASLAEACADVGRRCLIIGHPVGVTFPAQTLAVRWAPYDEVFPRAAAVVVHGGSGTTGEALRSGRPIVGMPVAYDQFTLCESVERLGVGVRVAVARRSRRDSPACSSACSPTGRCGIARRTRARASRPNRTAPSQPPRRSSVASTAAADPIRIPSAATATAGTGSRSSPPGAVPSNGRGARRDRPRRCARARARSAR